MMKRGWSALNETGTAWAYHSGAGDQMAWVVKHHGRYACRSHLHGERASFSTLVSAACWCMARILN